MDKRLEAVKRLIDTLVEANTHMVDIITSKPKELFSKDEQTRMIIDQLYIEQAMDDLKEVNNDGE